MKRRFLIGAAWSGASSWIEQALNLTIFVLIARIIGTEQFGLAGMAMAFLLMFEVLIRETLTEEIIQRDDVSGGFLEATWAVLLGAGLVIFLILCALAPVAAAAYNEPLVALLIFAFSPVILMISGSGVSTALLRRRLAFDILGFQAIAGSIVGGIVGVSVALMGYGAWALVGQRLAMTFTNFTISIIAAGWVPKKIPRRSDFKLVGGLGPRVVVIKTASMMTTQAPAIALGVFVGASSVAIYALSLRLVEVLTTLVVAPLRTVTQSVIAEMRRRSDESRDFIVEVSQITALLSCASLAGLAVVGDPAILLIFGEEWTKTIYVVPIICIAGCVSSVTLVQQAYLVAIDHTRRWVRVVVAETIFGIFLVLIASPYGAVWAAAAFSLRALVFLPIRTAIMLDPEKISARTYLRRVIILPAILATAMAVVVFTWRYFLLDEMHDIFYLMLAILIGAAVYLGLLMKLSPWVFRRARIFVQAAREEREGVGDA